MNNSNNEKLIDKRKEEGFFNKIVFCMLCQHYMQIQIIYGAAIIYSLQQIEIQFKNQICTLSLSFEVFCYLLVNTNS